MTRHGRVVRRTRTPHLWTATVAQSLALRIAGGRLIRRPSTATLAGLLLAFPAVGFLAVFLMVPAVRLITAGFLTQDARGALGAPVTLSHFVHFFDTSLYSHVLVVTLRISLVTAGLAAHSGLSGGDGDGALASGHHAGS